MAPADMNRRLFAWWFLAEALVARLTNPPVNPRATDGDVHAAMCGSRLLTLAQSAVAAVEQAWADSHVRRLVEPVGSAALERPHGDRIRLAGTCAAVAAITVILLQTASSEAGPLRWILPLTLGVIGVSVAAAAEPIARAWEAKRCG
jgi:hypothetical protein